MSAVQRIDETRNRRIKRLVAANHKREDRHNQRASRTTRRRVQRERKAKMVYSIVWWFAVLTGLAIFIEVAFRANGY